MSKHPDPKGSEGNEARTAVCFFPDVDVAITETQTRENQVAHQALCWSFLPSTALTTFPGHFPGSSNTTASVQPILSLY